MTDVPKDRSRRLTPTERLERDVIRVLSRPVIVIDFWVDLAAATQLAQQLARHGKSHVTLTTLVIKAAARAAMACPRIHRMYGPLRAIDPAQADVGVSVASDAMLSPVVVISGADRKSLDDIASELRAKAEAARVQERTSAPQFARYVTWLPFPLRRAFIRWWLLSPERRRRTTGTIQISMLDRFGITGAIAPFTAELLLVAGAVEDGARVGARFQLHADHQKLNGVTGGCFVRAFRDALATPEQLL